MDPQQMLLLEAGYAAFRFSSLRRSMLSGCGHGVFVGITNTDFNNVMDAGSTFAATGAAISVASGRLSFVLGLQGPCVTLDTACSAALVAVQGSMMAIQSGHCGTGLATAVCLVLTPHISLRYAAAGMLGHRRGELGAASSGQTQ